MIMDVNPILENNIPILSLLFKELKEASENIITIATAMVTNIERLGNSAGENEEIVSNIRNPPMMVVSIISKSFGLKFIWTLPLESSTVQALKLDKFESPFCIMVKR